MDRLYTFLYVSMAYSYLSLENLQQEKIWADGAYKGEEFIKWVKEQFGCILEVVKKKKGKGFQVLPRR